MPKIDADLAAALKQAKTKSMYFALVMKAPGEGTLIVSKNKVPQKAIQEAKKDIGGGQILQGRCSGDTTGGLIFETAKDPPASLNKTLKSVINRDAGLTLKVDSRKGAGLTDDGDQADTDASSAVIPDKEGIRKRLAAAEAESDKIQKSPIASGPDASSLKSELGKTKELIAKEDWTGAGKELTEAERLVARSKTALLLYQLGYKTGNSLPPGAPDTIRPTIAKQAGVGELIRYYDQGFMAGQNTPPKMRDYVPNNAPSMSENRMTKEDEERGREIDRSRKELKRVLNGQEDGDMPHTDPEPPEVQFGD